LAAGMLSSISLQQRGARTLLLPLRHSNPHQIDGRRSRCYMTFAHEAPKFQNFTDYSLFKK